MTLKLYYDLVSQPSRALYILLKTANCEFEPHPVEVRKGDNFTEEYTKMYKFQKVPVINHNGFILGESIAILRYLSRLGRVPAALYPAEPRARAAVDHFLEWHHVGLRLHLAMYVRVKIVTPKATGQAPEPRKLAEYETRMERALAELDQLWLGGGGGWLAGAAPSAADLWAACEVEQTRMAGYDACLRSERVARWLHGVRAHFAPHYQHAHAVLDKIAAKHAPAAAPAKL